MDIIENEINLRTNEILTYTNNINTITEGHTLSNNESQNEMDLNSFTKEELENYKFWIKQELIAEIKKNILLEFLNKNVTEERKIEITSNTKSLIERLKRINYNAIIADYTNIKENNNFLKILGTEYPAISIEEKDSEKIIEEYTNNIIDACKKNKITEEQIQSVANNHFAPKEEINIHM